MSHNQSYNIKMSVTGKSTFQMELFEDWLLHQVQLFQQNKNVHLEVTDGNGNPLHQETYSFPVYSHNGAMPNYKRHF